MKQEFVMSEKNIYTRKSPDRPDIEVYLSPLLFEYLEDGALKQLVDAVELPQVISPVIGLPDIHEGFGLPIGGVLATNGEQGVISAGAVGMDINCGVRLLTTGLQYNQVKKRLSQWLDNIAKLTAPGVGKKTKYKPANRLRINDVLEKGVPYVVKQGMGDSCDLNRIEENGVMDAADISVLSSETMARGKEQLATLGGGNHFIEICMLDRDFSNGEASHMGINEGEICFLIHTGSRGVGHQICTEYMEKMNKEASRTGKSFPSKGLASAAIDSELGRDYFSAMSAASNFAFANRHLLSCAVEESIGFKTQLVYDVSHNIAKFEQYYGRKRLIHRKGATRAFPAGHDSLPDELADIGQPAIVPGTMGTGSYVVLGTEKLQRTYYSVNHGAGRQMSRKQAKKSITNKQFRQAMNGVELNSPGINKVKDESPQAYKDVDQVVDTLAEIGLTKKIARLRPLAVIKG